MAEGLLTTEPVVTQTNPQQIVPNQTSGLLETKPILSTSQPTTAQPTQYLTPESKVSNQLTSLLSAGSPLITQAESRAKEEANRLGLLSSSMAVGAGRRAAYEAALPIAQADAKVVGESDLSRQNAAQQTALDIQQQGGRINLQSMQDKAAYEREQLAQNEAFKRTSAEIAGRMSDIQAQMTSENVQRFSQSASEIMQQYQVRFQEIQSTADTILNADAKQKALTDLNDIVSSQVDLLASIHNLPITWN